LTRFQLTIWGARGSIPAPAAANTRFGSDTSCIEVRCGDRVLVLDAGTGIVGCGRKLCCEDVRDLDILFTHCHFDHIMGLPFMFPLYTEEAVVRLHAGHFLDETSCRSMVERFMCPPYFPVTPKQFTARIDYRDFRPPDVLTLADDICVRTVRLNHPNGAVGYRIEYAGRSFCYITDTEHEPGKPDAAIRNFIAGSDLMIYDCMYTDEEFPTFQGFGHSTWQEGVRLCRAAGVANLVIFHHDISRTDAWLEALATTARNAFPGAIVARTGLTLEIGEGVRILEGG